MGQDDTSSVATIERFAGEQLDPFALSARSRSSRSFTYLFKIFIRGGKVTGGHAWLHSSRRVCGFYDDTATNYLDSEHL